MAARKAISASMRWNVFFRDGFACRYCGVQAGEDGIELVIDHMISVADGGDNRIDNLVTACKRCNGGKSAKSLTKIPTPEEVVARVKARASNLSALKKGVEKTLEAHRELRQQVINIKCEAFRLNSVHMDEREITSALNLLKEFGPEYLIEWYGSAAGRGVGIYRAIKYVCGCARKVRERAAGEVA